jgi:hypothetical protein
VSAFDDRPRNTVDQVEALDLFINEEEYLKEMGELLSPEMAGSSLVDLVRADRASTAPGYLLTAAGLEKL